MKDSQKIQEMEEQIPLQESSAVPTELRDGGEKEVLATSIREDEEMMAGVEKSPAWSPNQQALRQNTDANHSDIAVAAYYIWLDRKDKTDKFSRSRTTESDWARATRNLLLPLR